MHPFPLCRWRVLVPLLVGLAVTVSNAGGAQSSLRGAPPVAVRRLPPLFQSLGLSDAQATAIEAVLRHYEPRRKALVDQMLTSMPASETSARAERTPFTSALKNLALARQADLEAILTPTQLRMLRGLHGRPDGVGAITSP